VILAERRSPDPRVEPEYQVAERLEEREPVADLLIKHRRIERGGALDRRSPDALEDVQPCDHRRHVVDAAQRASLGRVRRRASIPPGRQRCGQSTL
jgi:hypothetical protein